MSEHRVPMLGSSWRRYEEPSLSRDPRVLAVVGALAELPAPELRPEFRAELRAQLVAITPRIVAESASPMVDIVPRQAARPRPTPQGSRTRAEQAAQAAPARHSDSALDGVLARLRGIHLGRPLAVAAAVVAAFAVLLGGAVVMSKKSLPGDALYGLKRASERFELATADSNVEKARDHLNFATNRAKEARDLVGRTSAGGAGLSADSAVSSSTAKLVTSTLASADTDVRAAAVLLGNAAVHQKSATPLATMTSWAPAQLKRLIDIASALPNGPLRSQTLASASLVRAADARAHALSPKVGCGCLATSGSDELGPVPCSVCTTPRNLPVGPQTHPAGTHEPKGPSARSSNHAVVPGGTRGSSTPAASTSTPAGGTSSPGLHLPSLPLPSLTPTLPVDLDSCGASVNLPILGGIDLNLCQGVHVSVGP